MSSQDVAEALQTLNAPTSTLSILSLADPILSSSSSSSSTADNNEAQLTPASLVADLAHYKDLFAKLRFSYVEQVTKERFLKAIVADPPELVDAADNVELEQELKGAKAALKSKKVAMEHVVKELQDLGTRLAQSMSFYSRPPVLSFQCLHDPQLTTSSRCKQHNSPLSPRKLKTWKPTLPLSNPPRPQPRRTRN